MPFALPIRTRCNIKTIVKDSGRYHEIVHAGVAFTPPHEHNPERIFVGMQWHVGHSGSYGSQRRGANQQIGVGAQKALERNIPTSPHPGPRWAPHPGVGGIIGWPRASILLLTVFIPDAILVATASWPGNLIRGTKLRQQEV